MSILVSSSFESNEIPLDSLSKRPPKSAESRLERKKKQRNETYHQRFINRLRHSFDDADPKSTGYLTQKRWNLSSLREFIGDGNMDDEKFISFFKKIDATSQGKVTWEDLVEYLLKENESTNPNKKNEAIHFIKKWNIPAHSRINLHRDIVNQITCSYRTGEFITVSSDSVRFWNPHELSFNRAILDPGFFSVILVIDSLSTIAVTTTNRRLLFYDLDTLSQHPLEVCASPPPNQIKNLSHRESIGVLQRLKSQKMPIFNVPSAMAIATISNTDPSNILFFIGDDQGLIEVFRLDAPKRRQGTDFKIERVARSQIHKSTVTQISTVSSTCYGSSSLDYSVSFWTYNAYSHQFQILQVFQDTEPVVCFYFNSLQKYLATCGISRDAYIWSQTSSKKIFKLGGHYNQVLIISEFETTTGELYILTMTNKNEFRLWDSINYRLVKEWADPSMNKLENRYSKGFFDLKRKVFIAASSWPEKWAEDSTAMKDCVQLRSHNHQIVGCHYSKEFEELISIDAHCSIKVWDVYNGHIESSHMELWNSDSTDIASSALDPKGRRLITSTFKNNVSQWNFNSGTIISKISVPSNRSLISIVKCFSLSGRDFLVLAGWDAVFSLYMEVDKGVFEKFRDFVGHSSDISFVEPYSNGIISGSVKGEIFSWSVDANIPNSGIELHSETAIECIGTYGYTAFVGDSRGVMYVLSLPKLVEIDVFPAHGISQNHSLSSIAVDEKNHLLYSADTLGYVKQWKIIENETFTTIEPIEIYRCHMDEIFQIVLIDNADVIATCGIDMCIRLFSVKNFDYIGFLNEENMYSLLDPSKWIKVRPFSNDPQHFVRKQRLSPTKSTIGMVRSMKSIPVFKPNEQESIKQSESNKSILPNAQIYEPQINYQEIGKTLEEYFSSSLTENSYHSHHLDHEEKECSHLNISSTQLEPSARPSELMNTIKKLQDINLSTQDRMRSMSVSEKRSQLRMPIIMTPTKRRTFKGIPKLAKTSPIQD